ncbi:MAG: type II methionyl aminopeptidase [Candidatus Diapherotrites archaeon]|nr:type II methionyl aminopeptidase [Candidatus Diapherotrites archaeon]
METKEINNYKNAARVWKQAIGKASKIKEGKSLLDFANEIEKGIISESCGLAFPINLSLNEEAAHYTPNWDKTDDRSLRVSDVLKIDIGVHKDGYICDGAITVNLDNKHAKQIEANELALENSISVAKFGNKIDLIGKAIEDTLKEKGFNPVYNLGGHGLEQYDIHAWPSLPNHDNNSSYELEEGAIAIEPFASTGDGFISESAQVDIFSLNEGKNVRNIHGRKLLAIAKTYKGLPFAERWLKTKSDLDDFQFNLGLRELMKTDVFKTYPGLKETQRHIVTQVEKSLLILEDKTIVLGE